MTEYPRITELLDNCARWPDWRKYNKDLETELRALLAERDALKAKAQPVRKLREYKGVTYQDGAFYVNLVDRYLSASEIIYKRSISLGLTDADHAAIYALKDDPWERIPSVEDVLLGIAERIRDGYAVEVEDAAARLRAAVAAEGVGYLDSVLVAIVCDVRGGMSTTAILDKYRAALAASTRTGEQSDA